MTMLVRLCGCSDLHDLWDVTFTNVEKSEYESYGLVLVE